MDGGERQSRAGGTGVCTSGIGQREAASPPPAVRRAKERGEREGGRGTRTDRIDGCTGGGGAAVIGCLSGLWTPGGLAGWLAGVVCSSACLYSSSRPAFPARLKIGDTFVCALLSSGLPHCSLLLPSPFGLPPGRTRGIVFASLSKPKQTGRIITEALLGGRIARVPGRHME